MFCPVNQVGTVWHQNTGRKYRGQSWLKRSAGLLEDRMGSSLEALSGPCDFGTL